MVFCCRRHYCMSAMVVLYGRFMLRVGARNRPCRRWKMSSIEDPLFGPIPKEVQLGNPPLERVLCKCATQLSCGSMLPKPRSWHLFKKRFASNVQM